MASKLIYLGDGLGKEAVVLLTGNSEYDPSDFEEGGMKVISIKDYDEEWDVGLPTDRLLIPESL